VQTHGVGALAALPDPQRREHLLGMLRRVADPRQCLRTLPSGPIHTVERMTPTVFLPYIIFSP